MLESKTNQYPRTIQNGHGETLTFLGREIVDGEERVLLSAEVEAGQGPPMHVHFKQTEALTVEKGNLCYQIEGQEPKVIGPGETVTFGPGCPHRFWAEEGPVSMTGYVSPPDNVEYFLGKIYESARDKKAGGRPDDYDAAFLLKQYGDEYDMLNIPGFVKKAIFPILRSMGRMTGKKRRFENAPPPIA